MIKRTYSKRALGISTQDSSSNKRRRVELPSHQISAPSSTPPPSSPAPFSDENAPSYTPPSSPPPLSNPLKPATSSLQHALLLLPLPPSSPPPVAKPRRQKKPTRRLTQMRLDLGQKTQLRCKTCGMHYTPSSAADGLLHAKFHDQHRNGMLLRPALTRVLESTSEDGGLDGAGDAIVGISTSRMKQANVQRAVGAILEVVETELGGVGVPVEQLLERIRVPDGRGGGGMVDRYKTFLHVHGGSHVLGVCLAERIFSACKVLPFTGAITTTEDGEEETAALGVSRIWVSKCARGKGIAVHLLERARRDFVYGMEIKRELCAFSQPTESGARLARKWFGRRDGWLVYRG